MERYEVDESLETKTEDLQVFLSKSVYTFRREEYVFQLLQRGG